MLINWVLFPVPRIYHVVVLVNRFNWTDQQKSLTYSRIISSDWTSVRSYGFLSCNKKNCFLFLNFKLFFLTDVSNYCEERKIKLSVNVYIKIARNLGSNFWNFGSNFLDFWQFFSNLLAFQWATFQHFTSTIGIGLPVSSVSRRTCALESSFPNITDFTARASILTRESFTALVTAGQFRAGLARNSLRKMFRNYYSWKVSLKHYNGTCNVCKLWKRIFENSYIWLSKDAFDWPYSGVGNPSWEVFEVTVITRFYLALNSSE